MYCTKSTVHAKTGELWEVSLFPSEKKKIHPFLQETLQLQIETPLPPPDQNLIC